MRAILSLDESAVKPPGYIDTYAPSLLRSIARADARARLGITGELPFRGEDLWTGYEFSWLNEAGKPQVAILRLRVACTSPNLVESKSMKLYLNGFAQTRYASPQAVADTLRTDLAAAFGAPLLVELLPIESIGAVEPMPGANLDALDVAVTDYQRNPQLLRLSSSPAAGRRSRHTPPVAETWHTHLFRSLCPLTGQPDWASVLIGYAGALIEPAGLLKYLVSFRRHAAFHEDTIEQIFVDIMQRCRPEELTVLGRFLRRGGLDINPFRSTTEESAPQLRLARQ